MIRRACGVMTGERCAPEPPTAAAPGAPVPEEARLQEARRQAARAVQANFRNDDLGERVIDYTCVLEKVACSPFADIDSVRRYLRGPRKRPDFCGRHISAAPGPPGCWN